MINTFPSPVGIDGVPTLNYHIPQYDLMIHLQTSSDQCHCFPKHAFGCNFGFDPSISNPKRQPSGGGSWFVRTPLTLSD